MTTATAPQALTTAEAKQCETAAGLLREGKVKDALRIVEGVLATVPRSPDAHQLLAMCQSEAGEPALAERSFRRALELAPDQPLLLVNLATLLRKLGRVPEALSLYQRATEVAPGFGKAWLEFGNTLFDLGLADKAVPALERAVQVQPDSVMAWSVLGSAYRLVEQWESAEAAFLKALKLAPGYSAGWLNLGAVMRLRGRADEALACFERAAVAGYAGPELGDAMTGALLDEGRPDKALEQAIRLTEAHPGYVPGHVTLANLLWEYGPRLAPARDAIEGFRGAVQARPADHALTHEFARFLMAARRSEEALDVIRQLRVKTDAPGLALMEAQALDDLGYPGQARAAYEAMARGPLATLPFFLNAYTRHLLRAGEFQAAADRAAEATRVAPLHQEGWAYLGTAWRLLGDEREHWLCDYERLVANLRIEAPAGYAGLDAFLGALRDRLDAMHQAGREPVQQSLRGGSQTPGRLFGRPDPVIEALQRAIEQAIEGWLPTLPGDANHPFLSRKANRMRMSGSWSVKLWSSGQHVNHIHPEGWMSSAFYVSLPPSVRQPAGDSQAGHLQFGQPPSELGLSLPPRRVLRPAPGHLALFPSYLWHGTVPFEDAQPRMTVAFDMVPVPPAG
ncbi:MAG TPA: tetratricopeptide repeat protein [Arenimonas sp.]|uniref:tetratricopeptide repeat protein n=1 Tax=Arenimonas sp. TaxID=1872635 RepID=UPI002D80E82C|nr:tetratricopeptide repeat protein [Arenimonas sp.]HEU0154195.1 tetratricopeptide repeat protein [Arenimonas sp.]